MTFNEELYLYGRCHLFALALSQTFDYEMEFFWDTEAWFDKKGENIGPALVHAYCLLPDGTCVDARGTISSKEEMLDDYDWNTPSFVRTTPDMANEWIRKEVLDEQEAGEMHRLLTHIHENQLLYRSTIQWEDLLVTPPSN